jgi:replicative DNA helicase
MTVDRLLERSLAIEGRVRVDDVRRGGLGDTGRASIGAAAVRLRDNAPHLSVLPGGGVTALREVLRGEPELSAVVIVDALPALAGDAGSGTVTDAVRELKAMALDLDVALVVVSPLPGLDRKRQDLRPVLDDFGAGGSIKQHADIVLAIYREDMYDSGVSVEGATELSVLKNRNGATGYVDLYFYRKWMRFEDMLEPDR